MTSVTEMTAVTHLADVNSTVEGDSDALDKLALGRATDVVRIFHCYSAMVVCTVGITANIIALTVFSLSRSLRSTTTGHYLIALTVAASIALLDEVVRQLNAFYSKGQIMGIDFYATNDVWCKIISFNCVFGRCFGIWMTVIITVERYITVAFPLRVSTISTPCKAKVIIAIVVLVSAGIGLPNTIVNGVWSYEGRMGCFIILEYYGQYALYNTIVQVLFITAVPCITVAIFTGLIIHHIQRATKQRRKLAKTPSKRGSKVSAEAQLNTLLVSVAVCFIVLRSPYSIMYWIEAKKSYWEPEPWVSFYIYAAYRISIVLSVLNYSMNFFLYCLCGSTFRRELVRVLCHRSLGATPVVSENGKYVHVSTTNARSRRSNSHSGVFMDSTKDRPHRGSSLVKKNGFLHPGGGVRCSISVKKFGSTPMMEYEVPSKNPQKASPHALTVLRSHEEIEELEIEREVVSDSATSRKLSSEHSGGNVSDTWFDCETSTPKSTRQNIPLIDSKTA